MTDTVSTADELADAGPRIAKAIIATHGRDRAYLDRTRDQFVGSLEHCPHCKAHPSGKCPACLVCTEVLAALDAHVETLAGQERFNLADRIAP